MLPFQEEEKSGGGQMEMMSKLFFYQNPASSYARNTKGRETMTNLTISSLTTTTFENFLLKGDDLFRLNDPLRRRYESLRSCTFTNQI